MDSIPWTLVPAVIRIVQVQTNQRGPCRFKELPKLGHTYTDPQRLVDTFKIQNIYYLKYPSIYIYISSIWNLPALN